jgi:hypothetical protein
MKSTYSNLAFEVLGLVLARVTGQTYEEYIADAIFNPLGMSKSTLSLPPDNAGVIPLQPHFWDVDEGIQNPTGGIYTSTTDSSKYLRYILTHYNAIATGVNWINPVSPSDNIHSFYGMPWEILHTDRVLKNSRRTVRFITKGGGLPGYFSIIATIPEFDLGFTVLVAGEYEMLPKLRNAIGETIVRAAEEVSIRQLQERYVGVFESKSKTLNSSITIVADERGLVAEHFISNGTDVLANIRRMTSAPWYAQMVPTLLYKDEGNQRGELWRMVAYDERSSEEGIIWDDYCSANIDWPVYADISTNEFVFWDQKKDGKYAKLELSAWRANMTRTEHEKPMWDDALENLEL